MSDVRYRMSGGSSFPLHFLLSSPPPVFRRGRGEGEGEAVPLGEMLRNGVL
jgi:hypothetical protein